MTTYASPRLTRMALLVMVTLIFLAGCLMLLVSIFSSVNYMARSGRSGPSNDTQPARASVTVTDNSSNKDNSGSSSNNSPVVNSTIDHEANEPRFPSTSSPTVEVIFAVVTLGHSMFGIVAVTKERANLLATYGHILTISCFIKMLFLIGKHCGLTCGHSALLICI